MTCSCSGFWPTIAVFVQKIPILGWVLQHPLFKSVRDLTSSLLDSFETLAIK